MTTAAFTSHEEKEKKRSGIAALKYGCELKGEMILFCFLIDVAPRGSSPPAVVPVALPGPTELYLSQVNKSFWHYKIFKGGRCGRAALAGGRVGEGCGG